MQWSDYTNRKFVYQEGHFNVATLSEPYGEGDLKVSYEVIVQCDINSTKHTYRYLSHCKYQNILGEILTLKYFSILRTVTEEEGIDAAKEYNKIFPMLIESCGKEFFNTSTLQKVLDVLREKPSLNSAHLVSYFGLVVALKIEYIL